MAINLTDSLNAATTKGKLGEAKQVFLNGDTKNLQQAHEETNTHLDTLDNRSTQMENAIKDISVTGGASVASTVSYDNSTSGLEAVTAQGAIDELNVNIKQETDRAMAAEEANATSIIGTERIADGAVTTEKLADDTASLLNVDILPYITPNVTFNEVSTMYILNLRKEQREFYIKLRATIDNPIPEGSKLKLFVQHTFEGGGYVNVILKDIVVTGNDLSLDVTPSMFNKTPIEGTIKNTIIIIRLGGSFSGALETPITMVFNEFKLSYADFVNDALDSKIEGYNNALSNSIKKSKGFLYTDDEIVNAFIKDIYINPTKIDKQDLMLYYIRRNYNGKWIINLKSKSDESYRIAASESTENSSMSLAIGDEIVGFIEINWELIANEKQTSYNVDFNSNIYIERYDFFDSKATRELCEDNKSNISKLSKDANNIAESLKDIDDEVFVSYMLGYALKSDGTVPNVSEGEPQFATTDKISVLEGDKLYFTGGYTVNSIYSPIVGYDINNNATVLLEWGQRIFENKEVIIPSGIVYIRASANLKVCPASLLLKRLSVITKKINSIIASKEIKYNELNIYANGSGDFDTITNAVNSISDSNYYNRYNILIHEGEYNFITDYFGDRDYTDVTDKGLLLPDYVNLIGVGRQKNIIINCIFPETIKYSTSYYFSPINLMGRNNEISNLTISVFNCRYCIHDQSSLALEGNNNYTHTFKHLTLIHNGFDDNKTSMTNTPNEENNIIDNRWGSVIPLGQGTCGRANIIIEDVDFWSKNARGCAFLTHDAPQDFTEIGTRITMENCRLKSAQDKVIQISSLGDKHDNYFTIKNCILLATSPKVACLVSNSGYGNDFIYQLRGNLQENVLVELAEEYKNCNWIIQ